MRSSISKKNYQIINTESSRYWKEHFGEAESWKCFKKIQKNPHIKQTLFDRYKGKCQFCGKPLKDNYVIHHMTYNHECAMEHVTYKKGRTKTSATPNCAECAIKDLEHFEGCVSNLRPVCCVCNMVINKIATRLDVDEYEDEELESCIYFFPREIKRLTQFVNWGIRNRKIKHPELCALENALDAFDLDDHLYRLSGQAKSKRKKKESPNTPDKIKFSNESINVIIKFIYVGIYEYKLQDEAFQDLHKKLSHLDLTCDEYVLYGLRSH